MEKIGDVDLLNNYKLKKIIIKTSDVLDEFNNNIFYIF